MPAVLIIRHAMSEWNAEGRWQGQADPPLAAEGMREAERARARTGTFSLVITSDLERARRTGDLLALTAPRREEPLLREYDVGAWSGHTRAEIERRWPEELAAFLAGHRTVPPGAEDRAGFDERVQRAATSVAGTIERRAAGRTLVVTHVGVLRSLIRAQGRMDRPIRHLGGYEAEVKGGTLVLGEPVDLLPPAIDTIPAVDRQAL